MLSFKPTFSLFTFTFIYCFETGNVRSVNQGKLEVVKQEMARVNVDILGISVNLTQMTIIATAVGRNPSEEME